MRVKVSASESACLRVRMCSSVDIQVRSVDMNVYA